MEGEGERLWKPINFDPKDLQSLRESKEGQKRWFNQQPTGITLDCKEKKKAKLSPNLRKMQKGGFSARNFPYIISKKETVGKGGEKSVGVLFVNNCQKGFGRQ